VSAVNCKHGRRDAALAKGKKSLTTRDSGGVSEPQNPKLFRAFSCQNGVHFGIL